MTQNKDKGIFDGIADTVMNGVEDLVDGLFGRGGAQTPNFKNPYQDIFGSSPFAAFGNKAEPQHQTQQKPVQKTKEEIRAEALEKTFQHLTSEERSYLHDSVVEYQEEVYRLGKSSLVIAHAKASLFVGDLERTVDSLKKLTTLNDAQRCVLGLISYQQGKITEAVVYLQQVEIPLPEARLARAYLAVAQEQTDPEFLRRILNPILLTSSKAKEILGIAYFNAERFDDAEIYFAAVAQKRPEHQPSQLNLLRTLTAKGKNVAPHLGKFYHETQCSLSSAELEEELKRTYINFPTLKIHQENMYRLL